MASSARSTPLPDDAEGARAARRLGGPGLAQVVDELARRFAAGDDPAVVTVRDATPETRRAVADLFASPKLPGPTVRVRVERLAAALGLGSAAALRDVVESLRGPLGNRRISLAADRAARDELWDWVSHAAGRVTLFDAAGAARWVEGQRSLGIRGGVERHRLRLERCLAVLDALPADGVALAALAQRQAGGPHELDRGRTLGMMVADGIAIATGAGRPVDAQSWRDLWESVGVVADQLSSTVLTLGLPGDVETPAGRWLAECADACEPVTLTLSSLRRWPRPALPAGSAAYVFENPSVLAEAQRRRWRGPPLVCSSGRPTVATTVLLRQLGASGARLLQHADFDPAGIAITAWLANRAGTTPWEMTRDAYQAASAAAEARDASFAGPVPATPWHPPLAEAMAAAGRPVYEEALTDELLGLAASAAPPAPGRRVTGGS